MASTLFRTLSARMLERKRSRKLTPPPTAIPAVNNNMPPTQEAVEEVEEPVMYPDGLPMPPTSTTLATAAAALTPSLPRRRPSIFNRLHTRNVSADSTATTSSSRSTATLAVSISTTATSLSRSVSTRARAAKRRSVEFLAIPMYEGAIVEDDALSTKDEDGAASQFDIIL